MFSDGDRVSQPIIQDYVRGEGLAALTYIIRFDRYLITDSPPKECYRKLWVPVEG